MLELLVLVAGIIMLVKFGKPLTKAAEAVDIKVAVWSAEVKASAVEDIAGIDIKDETVTSANSVLERLEKVKLT